MKFNYFYLKGILAVCLIPMFAACSSDDKKDDPPPVVPELTLNVSELSFGYEGTAEVDKFEITSNAVWNVSSGKEWCTVDIENGENDGVITVTVTENELEEDRTAVITVAAEGVENKAVNILQGAAPPVDYFEAMTDNTFLEYCVDFDTNGNGRLERDEADAVLEIDVTNLGITSLEGVECFRNLKLLIFNQNSVGKIDLSKNKKLEKLQLQENRLERLDLTENTELIDVVCDRNRIFELKLLNCSKLEFLVCANNQLEELDISGNTNLEELWCQLNMIPEILVWDDFDTQNPINSITTIHKDAFTRFVRKNG